jgi:spoIIIJ-associated protein
MKIQEYLEKLCGFLELNPEDVQIDLEETEDRIDIFLNIEENEAKLLIGNRGETMESLEYLVKSVFKDEFADKKIFLDVNGYKQQKIDNLKERTASIAQEVQETETPYTFDYLNSFERFVVHTEISEREEFEDLESFSEDINGVRLLTIRKK